jgi:hypothetical protein
MAVVDTVLGLLGLLVYIVCIVLLAAVTTWIVVKVSPTKRPTADS